jgi:hypothetical protein
MPVQLTFGMATDSSASMRVQSMLLPYDGRFRHQWVEQDDHTFLFIQVPEGGVDGFIEEVSECHPTVWQVDEADVTDVEAAATTR